MVHLHRPRLRRRGQPARVTVVIPCYNYGHYLEFAVRSVVEQSEIDADVMVVDDASPDGSGRVADELARKDSRVHVVHHEQNKGHIVTYNDGLARAQGEFVVLLSADDLLAPGALLRAVSLFDAHPSVGMVYGRCQNFNEDPPTTPGGRTHSWTVWSGHEWLSTRFRRGFNSVTSPEVVLRTALQREIGLYDPALPHTGDLDMWLRAAAVADIGRINGPAQAYRRLHGTNMSNVVFGAPIKDIEGRWAAFQSVLSSGLLDGRDFPLDRDVRRALATDALDFCVFLYLEGRTDTPEIAA